jgi:alpha-aminoadipate carrier protein LysW
MERNGTCSICEGTVGIPADAMEGELLTCPDCGTDLELVSLDPVSLERAPEIQEDWGE